MSHARLSLPRVSEATWEDVKNLDDHIAVILKEITDLMNLRGLMTNYLRLPDRAESQIAPLPTVVTSPSPLVEDADVKEIKSSPATLLENRRLDVVKVLMMDGPTKASQIARALGIPANSNTLTEVLDCNWFERGPRGIELTSEGRCNYQRLRGVPDET